ncbi:MAG: hypothetical protein JXQ72_09255 [Anaerolineae bacterium]|nr:hypothetical protein [Anaerolineae bacterium]
MASTEIAPDSRLTVYDYTSTSHPDDLGNLIDYIHGKGMQVMLKPHLEVKAGGWRGEIMPDDVNAWFASYAQFMSHYAIVAAMHGVELLCIGTEQESMTAPAVLDGWHTVINAVKTVYSAYSFDGALTYAATIGAIDGSARPTIATWFWDELDYASVTVYLRLSDDPTPEVDTLTQEWQEWVLGIFRNWYALHGKPVLFAEIGYRSIDRVALSPWVTRGPNYFEEEPSGSGGGSGEVIEGELKYDGVGQANAYEAFFTNVTDESWMNGAFIWQFDPSAACQVFPKGEGDPGYTVLGKPAGQVIHQWFDGPDSVPAVVQADRGELVITRFDYASDEVARRHWPVQASAGATIELFVDGTEFAPWAADENSLRVESNVPYQTGQPRYMQMVLTPCTGLLDWSGGDRLSFGLKLAAPERVTRLYGAEVTVTIVDADSDYGEHWQYSMWVPITDHWDRVSLPFDTDPDLLTSWGGVFAVPDYHRPENDRSNRVLDLDYVWQVWLTVKTTDDDVIRGFSQITGWFDDLEIMDFPPDGCSPSTTDPNAIICTSD